MSEFTAEPRHVPDLRKQFHIFMATYGAALPNRETVDTVEADIHELWFQQMHTRFDGDAAEVIAAQSLVQGYMLPAPEVSRAKRAAEAYVRTDEFMTFRDKMGDEWGDASLETLSGMWYLEGARIGLGVTVVQGLQRQSSVVDQTVVNGVKTVYLPGDGPL